MLGKNGRVFPAQNAPDVQVEHEEPGHRASLGEDKSRGKPLPSVGHELDCRQVGFNPYPKSPPLVMKIT